MVRIRFNRSFREPPVLQASHGIVLEPCRIAIEVGHLQRPAGNIVDGGRSLSQRQHGGRLQSQPIVLVTSNVTVGICLPDEVACFVVTIFCPTVQRIDYCYELAERVVFSSGL